MRTLDTLWAGGITEGVPVQTLGSLPPRMVVETVEMAAASVAKPGPAVCLDGCAGGTCVNGRARTFVSATVLAATARAIANPYTNSAQGMAADTGGGGGGAVGDVVVAPGKAPPATASTAAEGNAPPAGGKVQGVHGHFVPHTFTEEELHGADPRLQWLTAADRGLLGIFGNTIHLNDGTHLDGGIGVAKDAKWQRLYNRIASCTLPLYDLPNGRWAQRFLTTLTNLWVRVIHRCWNSEGLLVFQAVILCRIRGIS